MVTTSEDTGRKETGRSGSRAGVNSAPELECIANSNSGIELELPSWEYD